VTRIYCVHPLELGGIGQIYCTLTTLAGDIPAALRIAPMLSKHCLLRLKIARNLAHLVFAALARNEERHWSGCPDYNFPLAWPH